MFRALLICATIMLAPPALSQVTADSKGEFDVLQHISRREYASARKYAEAELKRTDGESIWANYALGVVHSEGEGNLARGLFLIRKAKDLLYTRYSRSPVDGWARTWGRRLLMEEFGVLGLLDQREGQLAVLDEYRAEYQADREFLRIWPLLKLGRFEKAREVAKRYLTNDKAYIRERAFNGLMAIEEEAGHREASYQWGLKGLKDSGGASCVIATNLALGARRTYRFQETINHDQSALKARENDCPTSPHAQLAAMYLVFGQFQQSLSSLKALRAAPRAADMKVQNEMTIRARFVELLYALGAFKEAAERIKAIINEPDRAGMVSTAAETIELTNHLLAWSVYQARQEQHRERASARPLLDSIKERRAQLDLIRLKRTTARQAIRLASIPGNLLRVTRPYMSDLMPWYGVDMAQVLGTGVVSQIVAQAKQTETEFQPVAHAYLDAFLTENEWRTGDRLTAIEQGLSLLKRLPKDTRLLRLRIRAWLADALYQTRQIDAAVEHWHRVLETYPTPLRQLRIALPVQLELEGSGAPEIARRLENSPRLNIVSDAPFTVRIQSSESSSEICIIGRKRYGCGRITHAELDDDVDRIAAAIDAFHDDAFAPKIEMTQMDISSLDGRSIRSDARQAIDALIGRPKSKQMRRRK